MEDRERVLEAVISGAEKGEAIADSAKVGYRTALRHLNAMQTEGLVSRDGERQQTRWRPTDAAPDFLSRTREIAKASVK